MERIFLAASTAYRPAAAVLAQETGHQNYATYGAKPNIIMIISDATGYWDLGAYLGGAACGMPTPHLDQLAAEGMSLPVFTEHLEQVTQPCQDYPPRALQSDAYGGPMTIDRFRAIERVRDILQERGIDLNTNE